MKVNDSISSFIDISVGAPQGTKLGPLLWLFYTYDLEVDGYYTVKYADDTSFYKAMTRNSTDTVAAAIEAPQLWSDSNYNMTLNAEKTKIINIHLNYPQFPHC